MRKLSKQRYFCRLFLLAYVLCITISAVLVINFSQLQWNNTQQSVHIDILSQRWSQWESMFRTFFNQFLYSIRAQQYLPRAIIIGVRKGGTRALLDFLSLNSGIRTARYEVHFFDNDSYYKLGTSWYRQQMPFALANQIVIEKTPGYFVSLTAARRVHHFDPYMKLLLILRDPVTRLISDYTQVHHSKLAKGKPHASLEDLVFTENGTLNYTYKPVRNSMYYVHVKRWLKYFQPQNLHIVDGEKFAQDPIFELRRVEKFLQLPQRISKSRIFYNATKGFYCYYGTMNVPQCLGNNKGRSHVNVSEHTVRRLRNLFTVHNEQLFELLNWRFNW